MSSISLPSERQIRHFFVADAVASETSITDMRSTASIGEVQIFGENGLNSDTSGDFYIAKVNQKGTLSISDLITPGDITYTAGVSPVTKKGKYQSFSLSSAPVVGESYVLVGKVHYGVSEENFITFWAEHTATTTNPEDVLNALALQINKQLAQSINTAANNPATVQVYGNAAVGSVELTAGASGSVDTLTVDSVDILGGAVAFNTSLAQTASDVADAINANRSNPDYIAEASSATVNIYPLIPGVSTLAVASTATTITTSDTNLGGVSAGTAPAAGQGQSNKYFEVSVVNNSGDEAIYIREKDWILDDYRPGLRTFDQMLWNFEMYSEDSTADAKATKAEVAPVYAKGQGYQMIELERFLVGHRAEFDLKDSTLEFGRSFDASTASQYYILDLQYFDVSRDSEKKAKKQLTIVSTSNTVINTIGNAIEARGGQTWTDL